MTAIDFEAYRRQLLKCIASGFGIPYEQMATEIREAARSHAAEIKHRFMVAEESIRTIRQSIAVNVIAPYREPRTDDMRTMIDDIERVEPTPAARFAAALGHGAKTYRFTFNKGACR